MTLTINIPDEVAPQIVDGICEATNYDAGSGKTKAVWAKEQVIAHLKRMATSGVMKSTLASTKAAFDGAAIN